MNIYDIVDYETEHLDTIKKAETLGLDPSILQNPELEDYEVEILFEALLYDLDMNELLSKGVYYQHLNMLLMNGYTVEVHPDNRDFQHYAKWNLNGVTLKLGYTEESKSQKEQS